MAEIAFLAGKDATDERDRTFVLANEGHTLGNALRTIVSRYPNVTFCGYTIPHPNENVLHFRIQCNGRAVDILRAGLEDLEKVCDDTLEKFEEEKRDFLLKNEN